MSVVYHYTTTVHLPWIIHSGELPPGRTSEGFFPDPDFLWATTNPHIGRTATATNQDALYRSGGIFPVRYILPSDESFPWSEALDRNPVWTREHVTVLEGNRYAEPQQWFCRIEPLPLSRTLGVEWRRYANPKWTPVSNDMEILTGPPEMTTLRIGHMAFLSERVQEPGRRTAYAAARGFLTDVA
jgi:hypothetical protein